MHSSLIHKQFLNSILIQSIPLQYGMLPYPDALSIRRLVFSPFILGVIHE